MLHSDSKNALGSSHYCVATVASKGTDGIGPVGPVLGAAANPLLVHQAGPGWAATGFGTAGEGPHAGSGEGWQGT